MADTFLGEIVIPISPAYLLVTRNVVITDSVIVMSIIGLNLDHCIAEHVNLCLNLVFSMTYVMLA